MPGGDTLESKWSVEAGRTACRANQRFWPTTPRYPCFRFSRSVATRLSTGGSVRPFVWKFKSSHPAAAKKRKWCDNFTDAPHLLFLFLYVVYWETPCIIIIIITYIIIATHDFEWIAFVVYKTVSVVWCFGEIRRPVSVSFRFFIWWVEEFIKRSLQVADKKRALKPVARQTCMEYSHIIVK